ncbi:MAG: transposase [Gammaproteobacteria bacterium]
MTLSVTLQAEIVRLYHAEHWRIGTIAAQLGVHHSSVRRVLSAAGIALPVIAPRSSALDPYVPFITETLERYPTLSAARLYEMVAGRGYTGSPHHFRHRVARYRPRRAAEAYLRLRTLPGEEAQMDWAHFGKLTIGRAQRPLMAFVMVLSYSRHLFLRFYLNSVMANFLRGHVDAFTYFDAVPRVVLYDNLKSAVLERRAQAIHFNPTLLELAAHYRFAPRPVAPYRGNEKGRVERAIRFVRDRFFAARTFANLDDLNAQAEQWCLGVAAQRPCPGEPAKTVREVFDEERPRMLALPDNPFPTLERVAVSVGKTPYARFDLNDYSVPHAHANRTLEVLATLHTVRIVDAGTIIAEHPRSFERGQQIENPAHIQALTDYKRAARQHRATDRLHHAAPSAQALFECTAVRGAQLGVLTRGLIALLDSHGASALESAIVKALDTPAPHLGTVRQLLDLERQRQNQPPALPIILPDDPRIRDLRVRAHSLADYQQLIGDDDHEDDIN